MNTHDLDRLVAYAATATDYDVADLGTFPDWFLAAFDARGADDLPPQAVFTAYLLCARRDDPRLTLSAALERVQHESGERLWNIATAFALSCSFERLKRAGLLESYTIDDPFSLHGVDSCTFSEEDRRYYASAPSPEHLRQYVRAAWIGRPSTDRYHRTRPVYAPGNFYRHGPQPPVACLAYPLLAVTVPTLVWRRR